MTDMIRALVDFFQTYNGAVTAVATVVIAAFTTILGIFTVSLARSTKTAANAAAKATKTAQAEFVASHRPQLRIGNIVVDTPQGESTLFVDGHHVGGSLRITNVGGSRADILDGRCIVFWTNGGLPMRRPYEDSVDNLQAAERSLLSGQSTEARFRSVHPMQAQIAQTIGLGVIGGFKLYVMGSVRYCDRNTDVRTTVFCREFRPSMPHGGHWGRFYAVDDSDYENES